ncbi:MAG TPA: hypothetical protein VGI39_25745 [Polyangiaceae bacterium]
MSLRSLLVPAIVSALAACHADVDLGGAEDAAIDGVVTSPDGAPLATCGPLDAPSTPSTCEACIKGTEECQANGCYGGYWCNASERDCKAPPKTCP